MLRTLKLSNVLLAVLGLLVAACDPGGGGETGTETNVMRVPCRTDADCGGDLRCEPLDANALADGGHTGLCETRLP